MKKSIPALLALGIALFLPVSAFASSGGKSSKQHAQARDAKLAADEAAEAKTAKIEAGEKPAEDGEKRKEWSHRPVRHKQTMPAAPSLPEGK